MTTPTTPLAPAPLTLWLTDRSRYKTGTSRCPRQRYLGYHAGPTGYGFTAVRESLPLATGINVHHGLEAFTQILRQYDRLPTLDETRAIIAANTAEYLQRVDARGYRGILGGPETEETITEQQTLISGLLWALRMKFLPWLQERYQVVSVEAERLHFLDCSCGASPHDQDEHVRRGCTGKALMLRTDLLAKQRGGQSLAYFECKTTGWGNEAWAEQWETDPQLALGTLDAEAIFGAEVSELYIVSLFKGKRERDRYEGSDDPRKKQQSPLCYGYCRPSNPPLQAEDWVPSYEWVTNDGETKRKSRAHRRKGIWMLAESDWPTWRAYQTSDPSLTPEEFWVRAVLPDAMLEKVCGILGPLNRQDVQLASLRRSFAGEEAHWQEVLWQLYDAQGSWADPDFQATLDKVVPQSWACRPFGKAHQCEFVDICHRYTGWDDPIGSGKYRPRLPHHTPELQQAIARGLIPAEAAEAENDDDTNT